ncbi:MAG: flagellar motor switch protein FliN, partial [Candidatus Desulforudis sp.]|nr:flagellar motor switch protein FliN [Desulforudis sp.]
DGPAAPPEPDWWKMSLVLDLPLKITVILGRSRRPIKEVLGLAPGSVLELATLADEPVEVLVNGALVAWGEVVVVNDNFGVRITSIISPRERIQNLRQGGNDHLSTL